MKEIKVSLLGSHGIPPSYGAFEETVHHLSNYLLKKKIITYVACNSHLKNHPNKNQYDSKFIKLIYSPKKPGFGIIIFDFLSMIKCYLKGSRIFVFFGYEISWLYPIFRLFGVKFITNVDGIEWRRAKWSSHVKSYFKFCELCAVQFSNEIVYDSEGIKRYYQITHKRKGKLIFYGSNLPNIKNKSFNLNFVNKYSINDDLKNYFVVVMRLEPENNIDIIVKAFYKSKTNKKLLIIGPSTNFFDQYCLQFCDQKKIIYLGPIYDRELLNHIRVNSFSYIHGHSVGGTNPTLVEAISLGNKIICYNSIFNKEVCKLNAKYFNNEIDLIKLIEGEIVGKKFKLDEKYSWDYVSEQYYNLITSL